MEFVWSCQASAVLDRCEFQLSPPLRQWFLKRGVTELSISSPDTSGARLEIYYYRCDVVAKSLDLIGESEDGKSMVSVQSCSDKDPTVPDKDPTVPEAPPLPLDEAQLHPQGGKKWLLEWSLCQKASCWETVVQKVVFGEFVLFSAPFRFALATANSCKRNFQNPRN